MRKSIFFFVALFALAIGTAHARYAEGGFPCDRGAGWYCGPFSNFAEEASDLISYYEDDDLPVDPTDVKIKYFVAIYDPGMTPPSNVGDILDPPGGPDWSHMMVVLCNGDILDFKSEYYYDKVERQPIGVVPVWAFPFVVPGSITLSNGHLQTQILSSGGALAAVIDCDQSSGSTTFTTYPAPLQ